jgi:hypothetical protein
VSAHVMDQVSSPWSGLAGRAGGFQWCPGTRNLERTLISYWCVQQLKVGWPARQIVSSCASAMGIATASHGPVARRRTHCTDKVAMKVAQSCTWNYNVDVVHRGIQVGAAVHSRCIYEWRISNIRRFDMCAYVYGIVPV